MIQAYSASPTVGIDLADPIQPWFIPAVPAGKDQLGTQVSLSDPSVTITGAFHNTLSSGSPTVGYSSPSRITMMTRSLDLL